jgi:Tol biopolymer transport system component
MKEAASRNDNAKALRRCLSAVIVVVVCASLAVAQHPTNESLAKSRAAGAAVLQNLQDNDVAGALVALGTAADLSNTWHYTQYDGLSAAAGGLHRALAQLDADERFEMIHKWSMPARSRRAVRLLATPVPLDAPPKVFARAIGERPRDSSFAVSEINGVEGLFSTAWLLVKSAEESRQLRRLIIELNELAEAGVPNAAYVLTLARIVDAGNRDESLAQSLGERLAVLRREQSPKLIGKGPVPRHLVWQFGYTDVNADPKHIDIKPFPFWSGRRLQGSSAYPDPQLGWIMMEALGGHAGMHLSSVLRWVSPTDGTLAVGGEFKHLSPMGDGMRARIVSSRSGTSGEWTALGDSVNTPVESIEVRAWDTIDFVVDRIENNQYDQFQWPVQLTLSKSDGGVSTFNSTDASLDPVDSNVLSNVVLAATCLDRDWLQPIGESMLDQLRNDASPGASPLIRPLLQRAYAVAVAQRNPDAEFSGFFESRPEHWLAVGGATSTLHARGASRPLWLAGDEHILQLSGAHSGAALFRYPLIGEFEFSCEAQQGGLYPTEGGLVYGGLQFLPYRDRDGLSVMDIDSVRSVKKPNPFIRTADTPVFNQLSIRSTADGATFAVNGHPLWQDSRLAGLSPWIGLQAFGDHRPLFRNLTITGSPVIPREVHLVQDDAMRGWHARFCGEGLPPFIAAAGSDELPPSNWNVRAGEIRTAKANPGADANRQSVLRYQRPLLDGESISYEFFYKPAEVEVHPSLGRLVFLIEPAGVRVRWITDGANEWTGLSPDNAIAEPLNRRGPRPLPLRVGDWNRLNISLEDEAVTLALNDTVIYQHRLEKKQTPLASEQQFGLFHDRLRNSVRVRNIVMTGDWPKTLPDAVLQNLAVAANTGEASSDHAYVNHILGEELLASNVFGIRKLAASLPEEERYSFLSDWVLPNAVRRSFRLASAFATTSPAPPDAASQTDLGGQLVAPAYDLVDVAARLNRLDELRDRVAAFKSDDEYQQRARAALLFLIEAAGGNQDAAEAACDDLLALSERGLDYRYESLQAETLVALRGSQNPELRTIVSDLCGRLFAPLIRGKSSGFDVWDHQIKSLLGRESLVTSAEHGESESTMSNWIPASVETALTRSQGQPPVAWERRGHVAVKLAPHGSDFLYYQTPLTGDFDVECYSPYSAGLMFGGVFQGFHYEKASQEGTLRSKKLVPLSPPMVHENKPVRVRLRVRGRACMTFVNGREINSRELPEHFQPWLALHSDAYHRSGFRDVRITGAPVVPDSIELAADKELLGWSSYFGERVGSAERPAPWRYHEYPAGRGIFGVKQSAIAGSFKESLLHYHRPIVEDAVIAYEFVYVPGQSLAHPALDRLAFLLDPDGVKVHWVTDGAHAAAGSDPTNRTVEIDHRRGPETLPLRANAWNQIKLVTRGDVVELMLNGQLIYERPLEPTNQRTFGLFYYSDQTELRVRNLVLRGDWPNSVPTVAQQELASKDAHSLDVTRDELSAEFSHSFVDDGMPAKYFKTAQPSVTQLAQRPDGLFTSVTTRVAGSSLTIMPRFTLDGDFDVEVSFEQLQVRGDFYTGMLLRTEHDDDERPFYRMMRMLGESKYDRVIASRSLLHPNRGRTYESFELEPCESTSGRLRLARRGETIYYLFAEGDSTMFRIIGTHKGSVAETVVDGLQFMPICAGNSDVKVVFKDISIRAAKMMYIPPTDGPTVLRLMTMNADGSDVREVASPEGNELVGSPEWSADGKRIVFDAAHTNTVNSHIFVVNTDGTEMRDLGPGGMPSLSPDGKRIVFCQPRRGVMMMNADGSNREDIDTRGWGAQGSPDGKWIAWGRAGNIIVMNAKTKEQRPVLIGDQATMFRSTYWNFGWSHDSRSIAFKARNRETNAEGIVVADIDSPDGFKILLASTVGVNADFSFSPDNRRVLFAMHDPKTNGSRLFTIDRDKNGAPQLLPGQPLDGNIRDSAWSPNGKRIAFIAKKTPQPVEWPIAENSASARGTIRPATTPRD